MYVCWPLITLLHLFPSLSYSLTPSRSLSLIEHMDSEVFASDEELSVYVLRNFRGMLEKRVDLDESVRPHILYRELLKEINLLHF